MNPSEMRQRLRNYARTQPGMQWFKIVNSTAGGPTQVMIYDEIGFFGVSAADFNAQLGAIDGPVDLYINSPGGEIFDGISIYNQLLRCQDVSVFIDGIAASAASFIAQAASPGRLGMAKNAKMMIHNGQAFAAGDAAELRKMAEILDAETQNIASIYADRSGRPVEDFLAMMGEETWLAAPDACAEGLADYVYDPRSGPSNVIQRRPRNADGNHAPMNGTHSHSHSAYGAQGSDSVHSHEHTHDGDASHGHHKAADGASDHAGTCVSCQAVNALTAKFCGECGSTLLNAGNGGWQRRDGKWVFDPDNDGDNDATPAGDSDHDYWSADGKQLKAIPPDPDGKQGKPLAPSDKSPFPVLNADVDNSPWDASKAWHNGATADDPAAFYKGICAGRKAGDPDNQSSWALPYKYTPSSPPNAAGVRNALARLSSTEDLTNQAEAKSVLEKAMKAVNPDYEPDDQIDAELLGAAFAIGLEGAR